MTLQKSYRDAYGNEHDVGNGDSAWLHHCGYERAFTKGSGNAPAASVVAGSNALAVFMEPIIARPLIMVATPCFGGMVSQSYMLSIMRLTSYAKSAGFDVSLTMLGYDALISRARSTLAAAFLDDPAATHLLFIDADISFEPQQVERLLCFEKDFTGALYPLKAIDWDFIPQRCVERGETVQQAALSYVGTFCSEIERRHEGEFVTGIYAGGGFQMIRRSALERMIADYPETHFTSVHSLPMSGSRREAVPSSNLFALFDCIIDPETGAYLSEDYSFCRRWRQIGGEIWIDTASKLTHCGPYQFVGDHASRFAGITQRPGKSE
jgi:hypothetical protein